MAIPSEKAPEIEGMLEKMAGRTTSISADKCVEPPFGCGGPATEFKDDLSRKEYTLSGMCQTCQDKFYG